MNKKRFVPVLALLLYMVLLFNSCSENTNSSPTIKVISSNTDLLLPEDFTLDNIKNALLEYLNYRLWLYPAKIQDVVSDKNFDDYIGKYVDIEIRIYNNYDRSPDTIYAYTSMGKWLAIFRYKNGFVYCDGQVSEGEKYWPEDNNYVVVEKYTIKIAEPHKPNYGKSQRKDKIIDAIESKVRAACEDFYKGADQLYTQWENADVYIVDFYEYEMGTIAWICGQDGSITEYPVYFEEDNKGFKIQSNKGYTVKSVNEFNEFGRFLFERQISDTVRHFKCNEK